MDIPVWGNHLSGEQETASPGIRKPIYVAAEAILEKISRMGTPVDLFQLFAQGRTQSVYLPHGTVVGRIGLQMVVPGGQ